MWEEEKEEEEEIETDGDHPAWLFSTSPPDDQ